MDPIEKLRTRVKALESELATERSKGKKPGRALSEDPLGDELYLLRSLIDNLPESLYIKNLGGHYLVSNQAHCFVLGASSPIDVVGKCDADFFPPEIAEQYQESERPVFASGVPLIGVEEPMVDSTGNRRWLSTTKVPLWDDQNRIIGLVGISRDISDQKKAAADLQRTKLAAEAATRAKSEFLAGMSHEIRTPMNSVLGMTELALDTELTAEQREYLQMIKASADSLLGLIGDILDFSKIEAGRLDLEKTQFGLRETLGEAIDALSVRTPQANVELVCQVDGIVPDNLIGDPRRLRQIISNLVGNAIKFTPQGEVLVAVKVDWVGPDEVILHFSVRDTGIGIPEDKQKLVFEAFLQVENEFTRKFGGSGLGLSITAQIVTLMGGQIWVESQVGQGSAFQFTARFGIAEPQQESESNADYHIAGLSVLVVDDNASALQMIEDILKQRALRVTTAVSGESAIAAMQSAHDSGEPFALALVDSGLPGMSGFDVAKAVQERPELVGTVLMMLSAPDRANETRQCRAMGLDTFLVKPIKQQALLDAIRSVAVTRLLVDPPAPHTAGSSDRAVRQLSLLLAEDNAINQRLAARILEKRGHKVTVVDNGRKAVDAYSAATFDLVLMDVQMPIMDGFDATAAIRDREKIRGGHIPIVAMTAHAMKGDRERCLDAGMDFYVSKPIQTQELIEVIESLTTPIEDAAKDLETMADNTVFNRETSLERVEGDIELMLELIALFFEQSPALLAEIDDQIAAQNGPGLVAAAHSLKGSAGNFGATAAYDAANRLEQMAANNDFVDAEAVGAQLQQEILKLTSALAAYRQEIIE